MTAVVATATSSGAHHGVERVRDTADRLEARRARNWLAKEDVVERAAGRVVVHDGLFHRMGEFDAHLAA